MHKSELVSQVSDITGVSKRQCNIMVDAVFAAMENQLAMGEQVQIAGFGTFKVKQRASRSGVDFVTGKPMVIDPRRSVTFEPYKGLKDRVQKGV